VKLQRNHLLLGAALAVTLVLVVLAPNDPDEAVVGDTRTDRGGRAVPAAPQSNPSVASEPAVLAGRSSAASGKAAITDLFRSATWNQPPPPPAATVAELPPDKIVPPMPFTYLGSFREGDTLLYILERDDQVLTVMPGEVVDETYLFNILDEHSLSVTYLPLDAVQVLETGPSL
jgi:hypothetical protein